MRQYITKEKLACPCCQKAIVSPILLEKLNHVQRILQRNINIIEGFVCLDQCKKLGLKDISAESRGCSCKIAYNGAKELHQLVSALLYVDFMQITVTDNYVKASVDTLKPKGFYFG